MAALEDSARVKLELVAHAPMIEAAAFRIIEAFRSGNRLYACGNGGSACDAMHLVEELVARYQLKRPGLPAHHLLDAATVTGWSNDYQFESVFARQVEALARPGDVLVAISTSGNSLNVLAAVDIARSVGAYTLALTGFSGGHLARIAEDSIIVPSDRTDRIQEAHITIIHLLCELIERTLFGDLANV